MASIKKLFPWLFDKSLPDHDPSLLTKSESSTHWETEFWCRTCDRSSEWQQIRANICPHCGTHTLHRLLAEKRAHRTIIQNGKWVHQYRYPNGEMKITSDAL